MTLVKVDLGDVAGGHDPDDHVVIRAEAFRESEGGGITSTAEVVIPLVDGVGQAEVEPGPVVVAFRCRAVADTREKRGVVPASGPVGIEKVLESAFEYTPAVVNHGLDLIEGARDEALGQVGDAVDAAILGTGGETVRRMVGIRETQTASGTAWSHTTEKGHRLPLGYAPDGTLDDHARKAFADQVVGETTVSGDPTRVGISDEGQLIYSIHRDGSVRIPGLDLTGHTSAVRPPVEMWIRDGHVTRAASDPSRIVAWGSSTIQRADDSEFPAMARDLGAQYFPGGQSGQTGEQISARIGSIPAMVTFPGGIIPASGAVPVTCSNMSPSPTVVPFEVTVDGITGTLGSDGTSFHFSRSIPGQETPVPAEVPATPTMGESLRDATVILNIGKNSITDSGTSDRLIDWTDRAFAHMTPLAKRVLVLGHFINRNWEPGGIFATELMEVSAAQKARYGPLYIDLHSYLRTDQVWLDAGVTPTADDIADQAVGRLPASLAADNLHFNSAGTRAMVRLIKRTMTNLHWY